jgi:alkanesulfonate monooxygenase SsuD/methylene tetrahydromethanopterin reductase-like flavin-dependent oxidoreductase (luciferase family)
VKLDLMYEIQAPRPWPGEHPDGQREAEQRTYREALEQINLADRTGGWNGIWLVEHHFREGRSHCPAPEVVLGALSQTTERLELGFGVTLTPHGFTHPSRIAEKVATVDLLSEGRVQWGIGRSTPMERASFGVPEETSRQSMAHACKTVADMWVQEYYEADNEFMKFPKRMVTPLPYQRPHPPAWMACTSEESFERAGNYGLGVLGLTTRYKLPEIKRFIDQYREAIKNPEPLTHMVNNQAAVYTLVHCAETAQKVEDNETWDSVWWWYQHLAEFTLEWEFPHMSDEEKSRMFPLLEARARGEFKPRDFNDDGMIIVGDPDTCLEKMEAVAATGCDRLLCLVQFGRMPHEAIMESIELVGSKLAPKLSS